MIYILIYTYILDIYTYIPYIYTYIIYTYAYILKKIHIYASVYISNYK